MLGEPDLAEIRSAAGRARSCISPSVVMPSRPPSSRSACRISAQVSASGNARCVGRARVRKWFASVCNRTFGTPGHTIRRASLAVQTGGPGSGSRSARSRPAFRNEKPSRALCATKEDGSPGELEERRQDRLERGGSYHLVDLGELCDARRDRLPRIHQSLKRTQSFAAPVRHRADLGDPASIGEPPVVSRSTAQKVTSDSGTPCSRKVWKGSTRGRW